LNENKNKNKNKNKKQKIKNKKEKTQLMLTTTHNLGQQLVDVGRKLLNVKDENIAGYFYLHLNTELSYNDLTEAKKQNITILPLAETFLYLSGILDLHPEVSMDDKPYFYKHSNEKLSNALQPFYVYVAARVENVCKKKAVPETVIKYEYTFDFNKLEKKNKNNMKQEETQKEEISTNNLSEP
jgi:hypothetical protein